MATPGSHPLTATGDLSAGAGAWHPHSILGRLFSLSLCDLFFLAVIVWSFQTSGTGWGRLLWDGDTALHTAIGNYVLDHRAFPTTDPFSYTMANAPWLAVEWGTGVLFAALDRAWALKGIVFVCGLAIAALITVLLRTALTRGADALIAVPLALVASNALSLHYHARPHLFTLLFLAISAWILARDERVRTRAIWLLPALTVVWANLHPGFVILFAWLVLVIAGRALEGAEGRRSATRYGRVLAVSGVASLANPFGFHLHLEILGYFRAKGMTDLIEEFQPPTFRTEPQLYFMAFLLAGLVLCGLLLTKRRYADAVVIVAFAYQSLISVRHSTVFVVIAMPIVARELSELWKAWAGARERSSSARVLAEMSAERRTGLMRNSIWPVAAMVALFVWAPEEQWPRSFDAKLFPVTIAERRAVELASSRIFTTEQWADYLLYRNYPNQRVFYDDRSLYGERMFRRVAALLNGGPGWRATLDEGRVDLVLCGPDSVLAGLLRSDAGWMRVDEDQTAVLFRRVLSG